MALLQFNHMTPNQSIVQHRTHQYTKMLPPADIEANLIRTVNPLLRAGQCFCVTPYIIWPTKTTAKFRWLRRLHRAYAVVFVVIVLVSFKLHSARLVRRSNVMEWIVFVSRYAMYMFSTLLGVVGCHRQHETYKLFVRKLASIDRQLIRISADYKSGVAETLALDNAGLRRFLCMIMSLLFASTLVATAIDYYTFNKSMPLNWARDIVVYLVTNVCMYLMLLQLTAGFWLLRSRYRMMNGLLAAILKADEIDTIRTFERKCVDTLKNGRLLHTRLSQLYERLTDSFGLLVVVLTLSTIVDLIVQLFNVYRHLKRMQAAADRGLFDLAMDNLAMVVYSVLWFAVHAGKAVLVMWHSDQVEIEVRARIRDVV